VLIQVTGRDFRLWVDVIPVAWLFASESHEFVSHPGLEGLTTQHGLFLHASLPVFAMLQAQREVLWISRRATWSFFAIELEMLVLQLNCLRVSGSNRTNKF
jgi:hypothetical protein